MTTDQNGKVGQAFLLFGVSLALVVSVGFAIQAASPRAGLAVTEIFLILVPALWFVRRKRLPLRSSLRLTRISVGAALLAIAVGIASWGVAILMYGVLTGDLTAASSPAPTALGVVGWSVAILVGAVLPGICEEVLFRGAIMGVLERRGRGFAVAAAAVLFGVYHLDPSTVVPAVFLGLVFGLLVLRTGSLLPAILAHTANNAIAIVAGQTGAALLVPASIIAVTLLPVGMLFWMHTRHTPASASPLATVPAAVPSMSPVRVAALTVLGLILAVSLFAASIFNVHRVRDVGIEPDLHPGDLAIVAVDRSRQRILRVGDIVEFELATATSRAAPMLGRVVEVQNARVTVESGGTRSNVSRDHVVGKVVYSWRK